MIEDALYPYLASVTAITDLVSTRIYPGVAPTSAPLPYITFQEIGGTHYEHMTAAAGLANYLVQIDVWAASSASRKLVANAVRGALLGCRNRTTGFSIMSAISEGTPISRTLPPEDGEQGHVVYNAILQYRIFKTEAVPTFT